MSDVLRAAVDTETTGLKPGFNEIVELAIVFFDDGFKPNGLRFVTQIKPMWPCNFSEEARKVNGIDPDKISDSLIPNIVRANFLEWKNNLLGDKKIIALGHNYSFDKGFLEVFLTKDLYDEHFHYNFEDSMILARALRSRGKLKTENCKLTTLAKYFGIPNDSSHSAYNDALVTLQVYKNLLSLI